jgi:hypothetical protein
MTMSTSEGFPLRVPYQIYLFTVILVMPIWGGFNFSIRRLMDRGIHLPRVSGPFDLRVTLRARDEILREAGTPCLMGIGLWVRIPEAITPLAGMVAVADSDIPQEIVAHRHVQLRHLTMGSTQST